MYADPGLVDIEAIESAAAGLRLELEIAQGFAVQTAFDSLVYVSEQRMADVESLNSLQTHPLELTDGSFTLISYRDGRPGMDELTETITQNRQRRYKEEHLLEPSAKEADDIRGPEVEIYAMVEARGAKAEDRGEDGEAEDAPIASFRKFHASEPGAIEELPSHNKFAAENALTPEGQDLLAERTEGREVVEIVALWKEKGYAPDAQIALYRQGIHDSIARDEVWFMGVVDRVHGQLMDMFGPRVIRSVGERIAVKNEGAVESVRINPDLVDPATFFDDMLDGVEDDRLAGRMYEAYQKQWVISYFLEGLDMSLLSDETIARLDSRHAMPGQATQDGRVAA